MIAFFNWLWAPVGLLVFARAHALRQATLLWTLAIAVEKQIPLVPFLEALADEARGFWRWKLRTLCDLLQAGVSIPDALDAVSRILPADTLVLIRVGGETGRLAQALRDAATQFRNRADAPARPIVGSLIYLFSVLALMSLVITFIMYFIVPKFKAIFEGFGIELPELTIAVISTADAVVPFLALMVPIGLLASWIGIAFGFEIGGWGPEWRGPLHFFARLMPTVGAPLVLRSLSLAVDGGRPLESILAMLAQRHPDRALRPALLEVYSRVSSGSDCWQVLYQSGLIRRRETALLSAAERTGNLAWALCGAAEGIERRFAYRFQVVLELCRPVVMLLVGSAVGIFVISMFLPIVKIINDLPVEF